MILKSKEKSTQNEQKSIDKGTASVLLLTHTVR